jgi:hypothetical protein
MSAHPMVKCSKCGKTMNKHDYLTHIQMGYACGPVAR